MLGVAEVLAQFHCSVGFTRIHGRPLTASAVPLFHVGIPCEAMLMNHRNTSSWLVAIEPLLASPADRGSFGILDRSNRLTLIAVSVAMGAVSDLPCGLLCSVTAQETVARRRGGGMWNGQPQPTPVVSGKPARLWDNGPAGGLHSGPRSRFPQPKAHKCVTGVTDSEARKRPCSHYRKRGEKRGEANELPTKMHASP